MTLIRRCDGCGNDLEDQLLSSEILQIRQPRDVPRELDFHSVDCIMLWIQREHR